MLRGHKIHTGRGISIKSSIVVDSNVIIDTFDPSSPNYTESHSFMDHIISNRVLFAMPMHGFEISSTINRLKKEYCHLFCWVDRRWRLNSYTLMMSFCYLSVDVPMIKAMDHLYLVVAKKNGPELVTWDNQMIKAGISYGVKVLTPAGWMLQR